MRRLVWIHNGLTYRDNLSNGLDKTKSLSLRKLSKDAVSIFNI